MMSIRSFKQFNPVIGNGVYIDGSAQVIGQVEIGDDSSIWPNTTVRGDVNWIKIGANTSVQDGSVLHVTHDHTNKHPGGFPLIIGNQVTVGHNVVLHGCTIEDNCLIGMGAIILDDAHLEKNVFLAAGALVSPGKKLESGYLYVGSPAKKARALTEDEIEGLQYSADHYVKLKNEYLTIK
ncbi:MAG: gamma carbonic anhydrase family protein [gamma proteobacterium symbiont of Bathyaustriella thionipta]|nr:gamma carbonic anhydrase family protein [gamma proteobacterium symbiont of Bathyaustriella thionipta]MCU7950830.1 gamma carbonic anhydrase family protein [gamma proteobacterium symbiont of Bathyaustriella thionipta]MCU7951906.1 gamma carbonic anhydrase family protein [gamma proteobacterium symbiont of Bathyaustriella thionipta]MCU7957350.1 gamma carbonic anhydrase family protein [gamma proteobacterium symbiont of Bathyaustriella thionipta]MCU7966659.1 gamma carbonic anhydrase family protein 